MSRANKDRLNCLPNLTAAVLERILEGRFRVAADSERGLGAQKPTNMFKKGSELLLSHHVLALRLGMGRKKQSVLVGGVLIATYRRGCYHTGMEICRNTGNMLSFYCTCFAGEAKCVHLAALLFSLARYQHVLVRDFDGTLPIVFTQSTFIKQFSRDEVRDCLSWVEACKFRSINHPHVFLHPEKLVQKSFDEVTELFRLIRRWRVEKKMKRGEQSLGGRLEVLKKESLKGFAEEKGIDIESVLERDRRAGVFKPGPKKWYRHTIVRCLAEMEEGDDPDIELARDQLELDVCPCDSEKNGSVEGNVECPMCRQWWHRECTNLVAGESAKHWKRCNNCKAFGDKVSALQQQKVFGLFDNDWDDLHK